MVNSVSSEILSDDVTADLTSVQLLATALSKTLIPADSQLEWEKELADLFMNFKRELQNIIQEINRETADLLENEEWFSPEQQNTWGETVYPALHALAETLTSEEEVVELKNLSRRNLMKLREKYVWRINSVIEAQMALARASVGQNGRATGWIGVAIARAEAELVWWAVGKKAGKSKTDYIKEFVKNNAGEREDHVNTLVGIGLGFVAGFKLDLLSWLSFGFLSPPGILVLSLVFIVVVWFALFLISHATFKKYIEGYTGEEPRLKKAVTLLGTYAVPLIIVSVAGFLTAPYGIPILALSSVAIPFLFLFWIKKIHNGIQRPSNEKSRVAKIIGIALSWFLWTSAFGVSLYLLGSVSPQEILVFVMFLATWIGTYFGVREHGRLNREWVVANIPDLTDPQRGIARQILKNLDGRPINLDMNQMRELVIKTADNFAKRTDSGSIDLSAPTALSSSGLKLMIVSQASLTAKGLENLKFLMARDENIFVLSEAPVPGISFDRTVVVPFGSLPQGEKEHNPFREIVLTEVRTVLDGLAPQHPLRLRSSDPVSLFHTPDLQLNGTGLKSTDSLAEAIKNPMVLLLESFRAFPFLNQAWQDSLKTLRALAEFA